MTDGFNEPGGIHLRVALGPGASRIARTLVYRQASPGSSRGPHPRGLNRARGSQAAPWDGGRNVPFQGQGRGRDRLLPGASFRVSRGHFRSETASHRLGSPATQLRGELRGQASAEGRQRGLTLFFPFLCCEDELSASEGDEEEEEETKFQKVDSMDKVSSAGLGGQNPGGSLPGPGSCLLCTRVMPGRGGTCRGTCGGSTGALLAPGAASSGDLHGGPCAGRRPKGELSAGPSAPWRLPGEPPSPSGCCGWWSSALGWRRIAPLRPLVAWLSSRRVPVSESPPFLLWM